MIFDAESLEGIKAEAKRLKVEWEALAAVAEIESGGRPLWEGLCPIRIEGHYFDARLTGAKLKDARNKGLASPTQGKVKNSNSMVARYAMLDKMIAIDEAAALESCSWGLGQVMGANWKDLGYASVNALVDETKSSVSGQVRVMGLFIETNGLVTALKNRNWASFAKRYNGPSYKKYSYDTKMAAAYGRWKSGAHGSAAVDGPAVLERGSKGPAVEELQVKLADLGYYKGRVDGDFGGGTEIAVMDFQRDAAIQVDGRVGPGTRTALAGWTTPAPSPSAKPGVAEVVYKNQHATRDRPVTPFLEVTLAAAVGAVYGPGYRAEIYSGGQARKGTSSKRTGSIRHDDYGEGGRALDAWIIDTAGKRLTGPELGRLGQYWLAKGYGGCGLEMSWGGIHLDEWSKPPPGGGMYWTYAYLDGQKWGEQVRKMLIAGSKGKLPKLAP